MSIHICQSHDVEILLQAMFAQTSHKTTSMLDAFKTKTFIVPNRAVEKWLTQKISNKNGISANNAFFQGINSFRWDLYQKVLDDKERVRRASIPRLVVKLRIFQALKAYTSNLANPLKKDHPLFEIIDRIYDSSSTLSDQAEIEQKRNDMLFWIAEQVSKLFQNYMTYRGHCTITHPDGQKCKCSTNWLKQWGENTPLNIEGLINTTEQGLDLNKLEQAQKLEGWQRWLWREIFHEDYMEVTAIDELFWKTLNTPELAAQVKKALPDQITIFTLLGLAPSQLNYLRQLAQHTEIIIYHFNPSQEYWADSVDSRWKQQYDLSVKNRFIENSAKNGKSVSDEDIQKYFDDFNLNFNAEARESRHPLLTRLGKQARDQFSLLSNLSSGEEGEWFDLFYDQFPDTLLGKIQSDILFLAEPEKNSYQLSKDGQFYNDKSIQVNACHSTLRQLEALKDSLTDWLNQGTKENPRSLDDILVVAPNIKDIEPLIRSVFTPLAKNAQSTYLPIKITGIAQSNLNNAWLSLTKRFKLVSSRFQHEEFADWLTLYATQTLYDLDFAKVSRMLELLNLAGFKRGFDKAQIETQVNDEDYRFTFRYALDRLIVGVAVNDHTMVEDTLSVDFVKYEDFELITTLIKIYNDLNERRGYLSPEQEPLNYEEWLQILLKEIAIYQQAGEDDLAMAQDIIHSHLRRVTLAAYEDINKQKIGSLVETKMPMSFVLREIQSEIDVQLDNTEPTGQITFSQIGYIRPLPFKLVAVLNLDSGVFPSNQNSIPFDLMSIFKQQLGDRSRKDDEQGAFLDTLLLAKENLWLYYNAFDMHSGNALVPSSLLQELMDQIAFILKHEGDKDDLETVNGVPHSLFIQSIYVSHSVQPFDVFGFDGTTPRFKDQWFMVADKIQNADQYVLPWVNDVYLLSQPKVSGKKVLFAAKWASDLIFPANLYLDSLNVKNIEPDAVMDENEPLILNGLNRYAVTENLQKNATTQPELLSHIMPVGKLFQSAWDASQDAHNECMERLYTYAEKPTETKEIQYDLDGDVQLSIQIPEDEKTNDWIILKASSAYAEHRAKTWIEYLIWLSALNIGDDGAEKKMIVVFSNKTVINSGISSNQAIAYLKSWTDFYYIGLQTPLVLPAKLILSRIEKNKKLEWLSVEGTGEIILSEKDQEALIKDWNNSFEFSPDFPLTEDKANKKHRDWSYILQGHDSTDLLKKDIKEFAFDLYSPIYQYQKTV